MDRELRRILGNEFADRFENNLRRRKIAAALALQGHRVRWAESVAIDVMYVTPATDDGMVTIDKYPGEFAPHLLVVVDGPH